MILYILHIIYYILYILYIIYIYYRSYCIVIIGKGGGYFREPGRGMSSREKPRSRLTARVQVAEVRFFSVRGREVWGLGCRV